MCETASSGIKTRCSKQAAGNSRAGSVVRSYLLDMLVRFYWPGCNFWDGDWNGPTLDTFWVECSAEEARRLIHPKLSGEKIRLSEQLGADGHGPLMRDGQHAPKFCFLISTDLTRIDPHPATYPWSGQWNGYCPFRELGEHRVNDLKALNTIQLSSCKESVMADAFLPPLKVSRKTGGETFQNGTSSLDFSLLNFWQWSASDLVSNALRGRLAEFLVAQALGVADGLRVEWDAYDLRTSKGLTIEVKSAAYVQTWAQKALSTISFDIAPTRFWDPVTNDLGDESRRQATLYVFALLACKDKAIIDPLDVSQQ